MDDQAGKLFAGHMGVCAVLVNLLIDKGIVRRRELVERFQQAQVAASQCSGGPMVAHALAEMVDYIQSVDAVRTTAGSDRLALDGETILVVEEQPIIARHLQRALEAAGAKVLMAHDAAAALPRIGQSYCSAAVLDWHPDSGDGQTLARRLKEEGVRFLFCATQPPEDVATRRGAPILRKPVPPKQIVKALALMIGAGNRA